MIQTTKQKQKQIKTELTAGTVNEDLNMFEVKKKADFNRTKHAKIFGVSSQELCESRGGRPAAEFKRGSILSSMSSSNLTETGL